MTFDFLPVGVILTALAVGIEWAGTRPRFDPVFKWLPPPLWAYGIPVAVATAGWMPAAGDLTGWILRWVLPTAVMMLLLSADLKQVFRVGPAALGALLVGSAGIVLGAGIATVILKPWLPPDGWRALGALCGTWIGGSANLIALKEILHTPDHLFGALIVLDPLGAYTWMALLTFGAGHQARLDRWFGVGVAGGVGSTTQTHPGRHSVVRSTGHARQKFALGRARLGLSSRAHGPYDPTPSVRPDRAPIIPRRWLVALGAALFVGMGCAWVSGHLPSWGGLSPTGWGALLATGAAGAMSLAGGKAAAVPPAAGRTLLWLLLGALGARGSLRAVAEVPILLAVAAILLVTHGVCLIAAGRFFHWPAFTLATASQACVGGVASTPIVAASYRPEAAALGVLLAIAGNAVGTYAGLAGAALCRWLSG